MTDSEMRHKKAEKQMMLNPCIWKEYLSSQEAKLPILDDIEDVTNVVTRIMGGNPGEMQLQGTNTYLVGTGHARILIDTGQVSCIPPGEQGNYSFVMPPQGMPLWAKNIIKILREKDVTLSHILLTHWHGDHTGGVPDLIHFDSNFADRIYKNQPDPGQRPIKDGEIFRTEGATVRALYTPGHAVDHMCFILEEENALFTGDNVLGHGFSVSEDLGSYMQSLSVMEDQRCEKGYPAHGVKIEDLPAKMTEYIRHKTTRERRVYGALVGQKAKTVKSGGGKGSLTTKELVHSLHGDVPERVVEMALEPFMTEVLLKLAEDRKVGFELNADSKKWFLNERAWKQEAKNYV